MATQSELSRQRRPQPPLELLTIPVTAGRLGCSLPHVYRLIGAGALRAVDIAEPGSRRSKTRIRSDDLDAYIDRMTRGKRAPAGDAA
jgi:excisionase family DNA binding protein